MQGFASGRTRPLAWRLAQLSALQRMLSEHEQQWEQALAADVGKPRFEASLFEIVLCLTECRRFAAQLADWSKPQHVATPLALLPASSAIVREPYGVVSSLQASMINHCIDVIMMR